MNHIVLFGDSIFDNARYVPDRPPVIEQVRRALPAGNQATLRAVDGSVTSDVSGQLHRLPADATHLFVSAGGNDALEESAVVREAAASVGDALERMAEVRERFRANYRAMLECLLKPGLPAAVCTVYDAIPGLSVADRTALAAFNEVILREAFAAGLPVIDLRLLCTQAADYSPLSSIEPSVVGGGKIAGKIAEVAASHDFGRGRPEVYF